MAEVYISHSCRPVNIYVLCHFLQGLYFVDGLLQVVIVNKWSFEQWNKYFERWLMLLLSLVDFEMSPHNCLEAMLSSDYLVVAKYRTFLHAKVSMTDNKFLYKLF